MTTIAVRHGVVAADSQCSIQTMAGGAHKHGCVKLFKKRTRKYGRVIIATIGETSPSLLFVSWFGTNRKLPDMSNADFTCLVLTQDNRLFEYDQWLVPDEVEDYKHLGFYAAGSGAKAALGAMHQGANAERAVEIACRVDTYSALPIITMEFKT